MLTELHPTLRRPAEGTGLCRFLRSMKDEVRPGREYETLEAGFSASPVIIWAAPHTDKQQPDTNDQLEDLDITKQRYTGGA
jgi:hypothetical protein